MSKTGRMQLTGNFLEEDLLDIFQQVHGITGEKYGNHFAKSEMNLEDGTIIFLPAPNITREAAASRLLGIFNALNLSNFDKVKFSFPHDGDEPCPVVTKRDVGCRISFDV